MRILVLCLLLVSACGLAPAAEETPTLVPAQPSPTRAPTLASPTPSPSPSTRPPASPTPTLAPLCTPPPCTADETYACGNPAGCPGGCGTICVRKSPTPVGPATTPETGGPSINPIAHFAAGQSVTVTAIHMLDTTTGWAVATGGVGDPDDHILRTTDGGVTWHDVTPPENSDPAAPLGKGATTFFLDANTAWVTYYDRTAGPAVASPVVWRTADAGQTWAASRPLDMSDAEFYSPSDLIFVDARAGWLLAHVGAGMMHDYVFIFATADGGQTWERVVDPFADNLPQSCGKTAMVFADAETGWVTGDCQGVQPGAPYLQKTVDGGRTWQFVELPPPANQPDLFKRDDVGCGTYAPTFFSPHSAVLAMTCDFFTADPPRTDSYLYVTTDGGATWDIQLLPAFFTSAIFISPATGWILARQNDFPEGFSDLYQTLDGGKSLTKVKTVSWLGTQFSFVSPQVGWAVAQGHEGSALVHTTDGGQTWKEIKPQVAP